MFNYFYKILEVPMLGFLFSKYGKSICKKKETARLMSFQSIKNGFTGSDLGIMFILILISGLLPLMGTAQAKNSEGVVSQCIQAGFIHSSDSLFRTYEKIELGVRLPDTIQELVSLFSSKPFFSRGLNPYDPSDIDLYTWFTSPSGKKYRVNGFLYKDFIQSRCTEHDFPCWIEKPTDWPWRVRFTPDEEGRWEYEAVLKGKVEKVQGLKGSFICQNSGNHGFVSKQGPVLVNSHNAKPLSLIGINTDWYKWGIVNTMFSDHYEDFFSMLHHDGANLASIGLINRIGLQVEWEHPGIYETPEVLNNSADYNINRQAHAWELDKVFELADEYDIYLKFTLIQHPDFGPDFWEWPEHPYHKYIPEISEPADFFSESRAKELLRHKLRYIVARWGYSPQIAWYELITEIDKVGNSRNNQQVFSWFEEISSYLKIIDSGRHLISASYATPFNEKEKKYLVWNSDLCSLVNLHYYGENKRTNYDRFRVYNDVSKQYPDKPVIFSEIGGHVTPVVDEYSELQFHSNIWATTFIQQGFPGVYWHWESVLPRGYSAHFQTLKSFCALVDWENYTINRRFPKFHGLTLRSKHYRVGNFYRVARDKSAAVGWIQNATQYWYNTGAPPIYSPQGERVRPADDDRYSSKVNRLRGYARISHLSPFKYYCLAPFKTAKEGLQPLECLEFRANIFGQVDVPTWKFFYQMDDFAYILSKGRCNCKLK
jgi:hypothetical protein